MVDLGSKLQLLRKEKNTMQKDIASLLGLSVRAYQFYEKNENEPNLSNLIKLADYFDVSLDYLVGRSDNPKINK